MDDIFLCPHCNAEHQEPLEAALGHLALCLTCAMLAESLELDAIVLAETFEIRVAA